MSKTTREYAQEYLDSTYPVQREVVVYYDPTNVRNTVLELGLTGADLVLASVLAIVVFIFLATLQKGYGQLRWAVRPTAGGLRWSQKGGVVKLRLHTESALGTAVGFSFALAAIGIVGGSFLSLNVWVLNSPHHLLAG